ncbi:UvrD-helicase domain-containing protein [Thiohalomonas denitrificans]|uniref:DNA 3'-5' helicase n=1 Tax=Thiohalomonas denitrificans TaxID=415747 RepID=A0A1G5PJU5_9GAMM|nr:UvrD-helicase domain-containing protein [Thiohalomonas denitrificans]SCZ49698.1 ATP-dependent helicase/nuclease subunit A [Thiohalomonas denitrificans]
MTNPLSAGSPGINATVMASAGTGKTWLLVTRLVRLLLDGVRPDAILAITFTRKAAAEMQTRLNERLFELACAEDPRQGKLLQMMGAPSDTETRGRARGLYERILRARQPVRTTTFHAFCQEVLRRFPLEADVPPGFELIERTGELERAAWEHLMAEATAEPDGAVGQDLERLLNYCGSLDGLGSALTDFLGHRSDWWAYTENQNEPVAWAVSEAARHLESDPDDLDPRIGFLEAHAGELREFAELLLRHPIRDNPNLAEGLGMALHDEAPLEARFEAAATAFLRKDGEQRSRKASQSQAKKMTETGQERFLALHASLCEKVLRVRDALSRRDTAAATGAWYRLGERLVGHFQRFKEEQRLLDFADLEWRAYRLLSDADNAHWVQFKLDQRIDHLLVDEFQDTNPTQWRLLLPLLEEMAAGESERRRSVFLVGDVKQSIYRFRRADPRLLPAAHEWLSSAMAAHGHTLHVSRRSATAIIECVNRVFGSEGPLADGLAEFTEHDTFHHDLWGRVEMLPLVEEIEGGEPPEESDRMRDPLTEPRCIANDGRYRREGQQIAARIAALITDGTPVGNSTEARPMHYGDVLILVRSRTHAGAYEAALREAGIPYVGADRGTLLDALEVRDLVALLEVLITPYNHLSIATVLRSPLFGCSNTDLVTLALGKGSWLERLAMSADELPPSAPLARAHRLLTAWRCLAGRLPIHDLLDHIYSEGDVLSRYEAAFPAHLQPRIRANLGRFLELALEIDAGRYPSLTSFVARLSQLREFTGEAPDEAPACGGERVRVMTIHAAKGLEAPLVFLADTAAVRQNDSPFRALVDWPAGAPRPERLLLVGRKAQQDTITRNQLDVDKAAEQREQANLLYVALTRARQMLFISGCRPRRGEELGWYGLLETALGTEEATIAPPVLESGERPDPPPVQIRTRENSPLSVPAALGRAIDPPPLPLEVSPSSRVRAAAHGGPAGIMEEDALLRGVVIHRLLELLVGEGNPRCDEAVGQEFGLDAQEPEFRSWWEEAQSLLKRADLAPLFHPGPECQAFCEVPIAYRLDDGCVVHGIIDRLIVSTEQLWIVDYKTHHRACEDNLAELAEPYDEQLRLYAEGVARLWPGRPVRASLLFTAAGTLYDMAVGTA